VVSIFLLSKRPYLIIYVLAVYVLLQFAWWTFLLFNSSAPGAEVNERQMMIVGEGLVFLLILGAGAYYIVRSLKRELRIAKLQRNFLLAVSHELRSPIATMKLYLQTLQKRDLSEEKKNEILGDVLANTDRLADLTDNIMTALRIEDGSLDLQLAPIELAQLTRSTIDVFQKTIAKGYHIEMDLNENSIAKVDPEAFKSILINLFENSVKYSPIGSTITVGLEMNSTETKLTVQDRGSGIARNEQKMIFDRFYRSGSEETRNAAGTGLGLYIVKALCKAMNGRIELVSSLGKGSTFVAIFQK